MAVYTGTPGTDNFVGTNGDDTFNFAAADLSSADTVIGGAGNDTLVFTTAGTIAASAFNRVEGIDHIVLANGSNNIAITDGLMVVSDNMALTVSGGTGADIINASDAARGTLTIVAGGGNDTLQGENGAFFGGTTNFEFLPTELTAGDTLQGNGGTTILTFLAPGTIAASAFTHVTGIEKIVLADGTNNMTLADALVGSADDNHVLTVVGGSGNDTIDASQLGFFGPANVVDIYAGGGNDVLTGGISGADQFFFAPTNLNAGDTVTGGGDVHTTLHFTAAGTIAATAFAHVSNVDQIVLANGTNSLSVSDAMITSTHFGRLYVVGGTGDDTIDASGVLFSPNNVYITAGSGADTLTGGGGPDEFFFAPSDLTSADRVDGGTGFLADTLTFTTAGVVAADALTHVSHIELITLASGTNSIAVPDALVGLADDSHTLAIRGSDGNDAIDASAVTTAGNAVVIMGGAGADQFYFTPASLDAGDTVNGGSGVDTIRFLAGGTIAASAFARVTHVEQVTLANGTNKVALADAMVGAADSHLVAVVGGTGNDTVDASAVTTTSNRVFFVAESGNDTLTGGLGADIFNFAAADLTSADTINGGAGAAQLDRLTFTTAGTVAAAAFAGVSHIEQILLANGTNSIALSNALVGSADDGHLLTITGGTGNDAISATAVVTAANSVVFKSGSGNDSLAGGSGTDQFFFAAADLTSADTVSGGLGTDTIRFTTAGTIAASAFAHVTHVEQMVLANGTNSVTLADAMVTAADSHLVAVVGGTGADTINASGVTTTTDRVFFVGGGGADVMTASAGADTFSYAAAGDSTSNGFDTITGMNFAADHFDTPGTISLVESLRSGALDSGANFDTELAARFSTLGAHHAGLLTATSGTLSGQTFLVVDLNGTAGYQAGSDLVLHLVSSTGTLVAGDFI